MIGVKGQYIIYFKLGKYEDFIQRENFQIFTIVEDAGNILPTFQISFFTDNADIPRLLNEGQTLEVAMGCTEADFINIRLLPINKSISRAGQHQYSVSLTGIFDALGYLLTSNTKAYSGKTGIEAIREVVAKYFKPVFNVTKSRDAAMTWRQTNIPDRAFVHDTWMHSYSPNSFFMTGITSNGEFIVKDFIKAIKENPIYKWVLTNTDPKAANEIRYEGDYQIAANNAITNMWGSYPREKIIHNIDTGQETVLTQTTKPLMSLSKKLDRTTSVTKRSDTYTVLSRNVHDKWFEAYWQNRAYLNAFSSATITAKFMNDYKPIKVLDFIIFSEDYFGTEQSVEFNAGLYIVTKVARTINNEMLATHLHLSRETLNLMTGDLL